MKKILITGIILLFLLPLSSQDIQITQIDTNNILFKGEIDIYFSLPGTQNWELTPEDFTVNEKTMGELDITALNKEPNKMGGIDFILLIDNSGSMYDESYQGSQRITQAKVALSSFLDQIDESKDSVAVYSFNTMLVELAPFGTDIPDIHRSLSALEKPAEGMSYTELYNSLNEVTKAFPRRSGRKAVIVLSDGENYSLFQQGDKEHKKWGQTVSAPDEIVQNYLESGITIDGINLSDKRDANLDEICRSSGGKFHDVRTTKAISDVYRDIREKITNEYLITVKAPTLPDNRGEIELSYNQKQDSRMLLVPLLFGGASGLSLLIPIFLLLSGILGVGLLYYIPFEKPVKNPQILGLNTNQKITLNEGVTIIGTSHDAHYSMAGNPGIEPEHATIIHDEKNGNFTLVSQRAVRVNNRKVKKRTLTPGDVIQIEGSTIIFDAPDTTKIN